MKDHLLQLILPRPTHQRLNFAREYLQVYLLRLLHERGAQRHLCFVGGTALRLLHQLPRFSEDLDFSLDPQPPGGFVARETFAALKGMLQKVGYRVTVKAKLGRPVESAMFRFDGLPAELGVSTDPRLSVSVKVEVDNDPPPGGHCEVTLIQRHLPVAVRHYDLASLFAGKLHALLTRSYTKGRDWFDLVWYLTEKGGLEPNVPLLHSALAQTGHAGLGDDDWRAAVKKRFAGLDWAVVVADVRPFLERDDDLVHLQPDLVDQLLARSVRGDPR